MSIATTTASASGTRRRRNLADLQPTPQEIHLHRHRVCYRTSGEGGPVVLLIHGIAGCAEQWDQVVPLRAERYTVIGQLPLRGKAGGQRSRQRASGARPRRRAATG